MIRNTLSPARIPESFTAYRWESLNSGGTVITALVTGYPSWTSAESASLRKRIETISFEHF